MFSSFFKTNLVALLSIAAISQTWALPLEQELPPLSDYIRSHLKTRHPSEYQIGGFGNLTARDIQGLLEDRAVANGLEVPFGHQELSKRAQLNGRITRCTTSSCMGKSRS